MGARPRFPHRDATASPQAALRPLFETLTGNPGAIPIAELGEHVGRVLVTAEVLVTAWLPGQRCPIHDHGGSACAVCVVSGRGHEILYRSREDGFAEATGERCMERGGVTSANTEEIHSFRNAIPSPAPLSDILVGGSGARSAAA